jgi:hypothetical protein
MLVFFCSAAAAANDTRLGLGAGIGYGYDGAGVRLELVHGHFGVSAGVGSANFFKEGYPSTRETGLRSAAVSVRFFSGDAEGLMLALSAMGTLSRSRGQFIPADATQNQYLHLAMLVGHRWKWQHFFAEAAAGPVLNYEYTWIHVDEPSFGPTKKWNWGAFNSPGEFFPWAPAVELGLGYLF